MAIPKLTRSATGRTLPSGSGSAPDKPGHLSRVDHPRHGAGTYIHKGSPESESYDDEVKFDNGKRFTMGGEVRHGDLKPHASPAPAGRSLEGGDDSQDGGYAHPGESKSNGKPPFPHGATVIHPTWGSGKYLHPGTKENPSGSPKVKFDDGGESGVRDDGAVSHATLKSHDGPAVMGKHDDEPDMDMDEAMADKADKHVDRAHDALQGKKGADTASRVAGGHKPGDYVHTPDGPGIVEHHGDGGASSKVSVHLPRQGVVKSYHSDHVSKVGPEGPSGKPKQPHSTQTGPKGGMFYMTATGRKIYKQA